ncbi:MAG TPA: hypothetical protein VLW50_34160 [Streptosporangiaceae bacterium]|nr:hypothetical protein [Streptosporangiaceae bacterium]
MSAAVSAAVIVSGAHTPVGRLLGWLEDFTATDLGGIAIKATLDRTGIPGDQVDEGVRPGTTAETLSMLRPAFAADGTITRIAPRLANELRRRGGGLGAAPLCGDGGPGDALLLRVPAASGR